MNNFINKLKAWRAGSDRGATAVEYGLMVALIAAVIVLAVTFLGQGVRDTFETVCQAVTTTCEEPAHPPAGP